MNRMLETVLRRPLRRPRIGVVKGSIIAVILLGIVSWSFILFQDDSGLSDLFSPGAWKDGIGFIGDLLGIGSEETPAFLRGRLGPRGGNWPIRLWP